MGTRVPQEAHEGCRERRDPTTKFNGIILTLRPEGTLLAKVTAYVQHGAPQIPRSNIAIVRVVHTKHEQEAQRKGADSEG